MGTQKRKQAEVNESGSSNGNVRDGKFKRLLWRISAPLVIFATISSKSALLLFLLPGSAISISPTLVGTGEHDIYSETPKN